METIIQKRILILLLFSLITSVSTYASSISDQYKCNGQTTTTVNFSGISNPTWTNSNPGIGVPASGNGTILNSYLLSNNTETIARGIITVFEDGQPHSSFSIYVYPVPSVNTVGDVEVCNNQTQSSIIFSSRVEGTIFSWSIDNPGIGLGLPPGGIGDMPAFTAVNNTGAPIITTVHVTATNASGCSGNSISFTITVNPSAQVNRPADLMLCNNQVGIVEFGTINTGGITIYSWTNDKPGIGLPVTGSGNISFSAQNSGSTPIVATILVTPSYANGDVVCTGVAKSFKITVNPVAQVNHPLDMVVCNEQMSNVNFETINTGGTTTYSWTNDTPGIGLAATGSGNIKYFTARNAGTSPLKAIITVMPTYINGGSSCSGPSKTFTITVNPSAQVNQPVNKIICNEEPRIINFSSMNTGGVTSFTWINSNTSIGLPASGTGNLSFMTRNTGTTPLTAKVVVIPTFSNGGVICSGESKEFNITINPVSAQVNQPADLVLCNDQAGIVEFGTINSGGTTTYSWINDKPGIGLPATGSGNISFSAQNPGSEPIVATITVTPSFNNGGVACSGPSKSFTVTVNSSSITSDIESSKIQENSKIISVFPNPAKDVVHLAIDNSDGVIVSIYNSFGELVKKTEVDQSTNQINVSSLSDGIYILEIRSASLLRKQKLFVRK